MNEFRARLFEKLKLHLESEEYRYIDNNFHYYITLQPVFLVQESLWFNSHEIPSFKDFIADKESLAKAMVQIDEKSYLYGLLEDEHSKNILVLMSLYLILGRFYVKFPYYNVKNIGRRQILHSRLLSEDADKAFAKRISDNEFGIYWPHAFYDLSKIGIDLKLYTHHEFLHNFIYNNDYRFDHHGVVVDVEQGDYVFDCGACMGDTALMFARKAGETGKIFAYEPHPDISDGLRFNFKLNPSLQQITTIQQLAVSNVSGKDIELSLCGAGSSSNAAYFTENTRLAVVKTTTIDDEVAKLSIPKLDFIKMDIEGSELEALQGAVNSIKKFKPKLAICIYHKPQDYNEITRFIHELDLGYKFYLEQHFMNEWETVLYAKVQRTIPGKPSIPDPPSDISLIE